MPVKKHPTEDSKKLDSVARKVLTFSKGQLEHITFKTAQLRANRRWFRWDRPRASDGD